MSHRIDAAGSIEVPSLALTGLLNRLAPNGGRIDLMKIDIEGSEEAFLCADPAALDRVDALVVELHPTLCDTARVEALLRERFSTIRVIEARKSSKPLLYCRRDT